MVKIYDLENAPLNARNGRYMGQSGLKEGIDFEGKSWLVKYPKTTYGDEKKKVWTFHTRPLRYQNMLEAIFMIFWDMMCMKQFWE